MAYRGLLTAFLAFGTTATAVIFDAGTASAQLAARKPNIVVMLADNLGYGELGAYGGA